MGTTIRDVARRAGVGSGTVSRVLNDSPRVDPATRRRILAAIAELDYEPNPSARRLSLGKTLTIGVVVVFLTRPSVVERLRGVELVLSRSGYDLTIVNVETAERRATVLRDIARPDRVDGLIIMSLSPHKEEVERIRQLGLPVVLLGAFHRRLPRIVIDDVTGGRMACQHLIDLGHTDIGFIGNHPSSPFGISSSRLRHRGVQQALAAVGGSLRSDYVRIGELSQHRARELTLQLLCLPVPPTAIVCATDTQAFGALGAAKQAGFRVPEDLSIVGYDDLEIASYIGLTTIRQPLFESGVRSAQLLLAQLRGEEVGPVREALPIELVVRATTGPPRAPAPR